VEEGPDRWAPPVCDSGAQVPLVSGRKRGKGCWPGGADWAATSGPRWGMSRRREKRKEDGGVTAFGPQARGGGFFSFF